MASNEVDKRERDDDEKSNCSEFSSARIFKCCSKTCKAMVCKICDTFYHEGCVKRMKNVVYINDSVILCCQQNQTSSDDKDEEKSATDWVSKYKISKLEMEITYLKQLVHEMQEKNAIMSQNNFLLVEKINEMENQQKYRHRAPSVASSINRCIQVEENISKHNMYRNLQKPMENSVNQQKWNTRELPRINLEEIDKKNSNKARNSGITTSGRSNNSNKQNKSSSLSNMLVVDNNTQEDENQQNKTVQEQIFRNISENESNDNIPKINDNDTSEAVIMNKQMKNLKLNEDPNWKTVVYRNRRQYSTKQRPQPVKGEIETTKLMAAKQLSCLFLTGLKPKTPVEEVKNYITETFNINVSCEEMKTKKDIYKSSFKLYVPLESKEIVMDPNKWGKGISINHFLHLRQYLNREK